MIQNSIVLNYENNNHFIKNIKKKMSMMDNSNLNQELLNLALNKKFFSNQETPQINSKTKSNKIEALIHQLQKIRVSTTKNEKKKKKKNVIKHEVLSNSYSSDGYSDSTTETIKPIVKECEHSSIYESDYGKDYDCKLLKEQVL